MTKKQFFITSFSQVNKVLFNGIFKFCSNVALIMKIILIVMHKYEDMRMCTDILICKYHLLNRLVLPYTQSK